MVTQRDEQVREIDLLECVRIILKRKTIVFGTLLVAVFSTAVWSFFLPKIYEVSVIIEPPISAITDTGVQGWDSGANIKAKIEVGAYNPEILDGTLPLEDPPQFIVSMLKDTRLIKVILRLPVDQVDRGTKILAKLLERLNSGYAKILEDKRDRIDNQIKVVQSQIEKKENDIKLQGEQAKLLEARERQFSEDIKEVRTNSERLLAKRESVFERKENKDDVAALFYAATIQQNYSYLTQLQNDLSEARSRKESALNAIENLKSSIAESRIEIGNLNLLRGGVQNILVLQEPRRSSRPVGPKRKRNVLIAGVIGLMAGLLAAFFLESLEQRRV